MKRNRLHWGLIGFVAAILVGVPGYVLYGSYKEAKIEAAEALSGLEMEEERANDPLAQLDIIKAEFAAGESTDKRNLKKVIESVEKAIEKEVQAQAAENKPASEVLTSSPTQPQEIPPEPEVSTPPTQPLENPPAVEVATSTVQTLELPQSSEISASPTKILPPEGDNFLACEKVSKLEPSGCKNSFPPGKVYVFARVVTKGDETLTLKWSDKADIPISSRQFEVKPSSQGYRIYSYKSFYQDGSYKACLYDQQDRLVDQCAKFNVGKK